MSPTTPLKAVHVMSKAPAMLCTQVSVKVTRGDSVQASPAAPQVVSQSAPNDELRHCTPVLLHATSKVRGGGGEAGGDGGCAGGAGGAGGVDGGAGGGECWQGQKR